MSDIEKVLLAIAESRAYSEKQHKETKRAVQNIAAEQVRQNTVQVQQHGEIEALKETVKRKFDTASHGIRQASESDATLAANLAAVATATATQATETRALSDRMSRFESTVAGVPAATATATALATKGENDKLRKRISMHPVTQAAAIFLGTAGGAMAYRFVMALIGGH